MIRLPTAWMYSSELLEEVFFEQERSPDLVDAGFVETPLYGPEALAERDALIAEVEKEIERLRLNVDAAEALNVSAYHAGLKAGWNYCVSDDNARMNAALNNTDHIKELRRVRKAIATLEMKHGR